jgi:hypothetical protein
LVYNAIASGRAKEACVRIFLIAVIFLLNALPLLAQQETIPQEMRIKAQTQEIELRPGLIPGTQVHLTGARDSAWCEIAVVLGPPSKLQLKATPKGPAELYAQLYNTTGTTGPEGGCPADAFATLDGSKLAAALAAEAVFLNPTPQIARRYWVMDELQVYRAGETANFMGVAATWVGAVPPEQLRNAMSAPYVGVEIHLESRFVYQRGSSVFLLRAPGGNAWVMQSYTTEVDAELSLEELPELASKLDLPAGWAFEAKRLAKDLTVDPRNNYGTAHMVRDDLHNVYEGCGFDTACSYVP